MGKAQFNNLPARPDDVAAVAKLIRRHQPISQKDLLDLAGLTKTRVLCALDELINREKVTEPTARVYALKDALKSSD